MEDFSLEQQQAIAIAQAKMRMAQSKPEQGNMYTQGAEDIQYSPEGIPLNTSSYGSANPYQKTTKALNTLVSTPLNIATGAAKLPAAVVQTYDKYIGGGNTGDNMVNTINQIESGTQAQAGNIGKPLLQGSSIVGEVAPYMLSPVKTGAPTFLEQTATKVAPTIANYTQKGGQLVDNAIGMLPSFAQKVLPSANLVGNVAKGVGIGGATALTSPETVGLTPEQFAQAKENKIKTGMAIGGGLPIVGNTLSALNTSTGLNLGRKLTETPSADELLEKSKRLFGEAKDLGVEVNAN